jgi:hypothetical protein
MSDKSPAATLTSTWVVFAAAIVAAVMILGIGIPVSIASVSGGTVSARYVATPTPSASDTPAATETVDVPGVIGMKQSTAREVLQNRGFAVVDKAAAERAAVDDPIVIGQDPEEGVTVGLGSVVQLQFAEPAPTRTPTPTPTPTAVPPVPVPATSTLTYSVWGNGTMANSVTYSIPNGAFSQAQANGAPLPWKIDLPITGSNNVYTVLAQAGDGNSISCTISINGTIVDQQTSTGDYSIVTCSHY